MSVLARVAVLMGLVLALSFPSSAGAQEGPTDLVGTFRLQPGACGGSVSGSYFRMILPTGGPGGPYVSNGDSACGDKTFTPLEPGSDGGLVTGAYQPAPSPGFDSSGNSLAARIIRPTRFFGVNFSVSTDRNDLQTGMAVPAPAVRSDGGQLAGDLAAFGATWNNQSFNQGSPKPNGTHPGNTAGPTGTYDAATAAFTLAWTSQIVGGPFDNFTGEWHLAGTFVPAGTAGPPETPGAAESATTTPPTAAPTDGAGANVTTGSDPAATPGGPATPSAGTDAGATQTGAGATGAPVTSVEVIDAGWEAPTWLVLVLAGVGIAAVVVLVMLDRSKAAPA